MKGATPLVGEIVVADAGLAGPERGSRQSSSFGMCGRGRHLDGPGKLRARAGHGDNPKEVVSWLRQGDGRGRKLAAEDSGLAHQIEELFARLRSHDGFIGRTQGGDHAGQTSVILFAFELIQGKRDVLRQSLHSPNNLVIERARICETNQKYPYNGSASGDGQSHSSADSREYSHLTPNSYALVTLRIIGDTRMTRMKRKSHEILRVGRGSIRRCFWSTQHLKSFSRAAGICQPAVCVGYEDRCGDRRAAACNDGVANPLMEFPVRCCAQNGVVGGAECGQHPRRICLISHRALPTEFLASGSRECTSGI